MSQSTPKRKSSSDAGPHASRRFHSLVVPVDLTPSSDRALGRLTLLPLADDVRLTLVHVVPKSLPPLDQKHAERDAHKVLADEVRHLRKQLSRKASVEALVRVGAPAKEIAACATKLKPELIVMGRGRGRALRDTFVGSTAERVVRQARLPVLVVRLPSRAVYRRPALALDLHPSAHEVIRFMLRVLAPPRPRVEVIHAFDAPYGRLAYPSVSNEAAEEREEELRRAATRKLSKLLAAALEKAGTPPEDAPPWKTHVRLGSPRLVVEKVAKKADTDLLVLGTRGFTGAAHVFLGTVAGDLLRAAKCDVLMVPPR